MIRLHCTKKLFDRLPLDNGGRIKCPRPHEHAANDDVPLLGDWHANLYHFQRRPCVLFIHDETRFPVFVPALNKQRFADLDYWFHDGFVNTLMKVGADESILNAAAKTWSPLVCDRETSRSVLGTMNQMSMALEMEFHHSGVNVNEILGYRHGAWLADTPCTVKGVRDCIWPISAMQDLLHKL